MALKQCRKNQFANLEQFKNYQGKNNKNQNLENIDIQKTCRNVKHCASHFARFYHFDNGYVLLNAITSPKNLTNASLLVCHSLKLICISPAFPKFVNFIYGSSQIITYMFNMSLNTSCCRWTLGCLSALEQTKLTCICKDFLSRLPPAMRSSSSSSPHAVALNHSTCDQRAFPQFKLFL